MFRGDFLDEAKKTICNDRQDVYGSPENSFPIIAKYWETYLSEILHTDIELTPRNVADLLCLFKLARITTGAYKEDNYVDLCGYAAIAGSLENSEDDEEEDFDEYNYWIEEKNKMIEELGEIRKSCSVSFTEYNEELRKNQFEEVLKLSDYLLSEYLTKYNSDNNEFVEKSEWDLNHLIDTSLIMDRENRTEKITRNIRKLNDIILNSFFDMGLRSKYKKYLDEEDDQSLIANDMCNKKSHKSDRVHSLIYALQALNKVEKND